MFSAEYLADEGRRDAALSGSRRADLPHVSVPTLVLVAAGGDLLTPDGEAVADAIPGARCRTIPGAGHAVTLEAPAAVTDAIRAQLEAG